MPSLFLANWLDDRVGNYTYGEILKWSLLGLLVLGVVILFVKKGVGIRKFLNEVGVELRKTAWPWDAKEKGFKRFKELTDSTMVVVVALVLLGAYVAFWDVIMLGVMKLFTFGL